MARKPMLTICVAVLIVILGLVSFTAYRVHQQPVDVGGGGEAERRRLERLPADVIQRHHELRHELRKLEK